MRNWETKVLGVTALVCSSTFVLAAVPFLLAWFGRHFVQQQRHGSLLRKAHMSVRRKGERLLTGRRAWRLTQDGYSSEPDDIEKSRMSRESTICGGSSRESSGMLRSADTMPDLPFEQCSSCSVSRDGLANFFSDNDSVTKGEDRQNWSEFFEQNVDAYKMLFEFLYAPARLSFGSMCKAVLGVALQMGGIALLMTYYGFLKTFHEGSAIGAWEPMFLEDDDYFGLYCRCFCFLMLYFMLRLDFARNLSLMDFAWHHPAPGSGFTCAMLLAMVADVVAMLNLFFGAVLILHCKKPIEVMMQFATLTFVVLVTNWLTRPVQDTSDWAYTVPFSQLEQEWRRPYHRGFSWTHQIVHVLLVMFLFFVYIPLWSYRDGGDSPQFPVSAVAALPFASMGTPAVFI